MGNKNQKQPIRATWRNVSPELVESVPDVVDPTTSRSGKPTPMNNNKTSDFPRISKNSSLLLKQKATKPLCARAKEVYHSTISYRQEVFQLQVHEPLTFHLQTENLQ